MSARRRKNPDTLTLALGVGVMGLLVAGGVWWYVSQTEEAASSEEGQNGRAALKARVAARGGKRVGGVSMSLSSSGAFQPSLRQPSGLPNISLRPSSSSSSSSSSEEEASPDPADLTQPFSADGAPV